MGAHPHELNLQYGVLAIGEDDGGHIQALPGLGPQRLHCVHAAAVCLQVQHPPVGAGDGGADGHGNAHADGTAGEVEHIMRRRACGHRWNREARGGRLVNDDGVFRQQRRHGHRGGFGGERAVRRIDLPQCADPGRQATGIQGFSRLRQGGQRVFAAFAKRVNGASRWRQFAGPARIGEEADRRLGVHQDQVPNARQRLFRLFGEVGQAGQLHSPGAARDPCQEGIAQQFGARRLSNAAGGTQGFLTDAFAVHQQGAGFAAAQRSHCRIDPLRVRGLQRGGGQWRGWPLCVVPSGVCGQDQGGDAAWRALSGLNGFGGVGGHALRAFSQADPAGYRTRETGDVGGERRVECPVVGGVLADHVDDRREGAPGVVQIG